MTRVARAAAAILALLIIASVLGPMLARGRPESIGDVLAGRFVPPFGFDAHGGFHLFGTDSLGRDLFVRMLLAGRISCGNERPPNRRPGSSADWRTGTR